MADDAHWMEKAFSKNKGALHRELGVPQGKKIPRAKLGRAVHASGKLGQRARAAANAQHAHARKTLYGK